MPETIDPSQIPGVRKAAILMISLDTETSSVIMSNMEPTSVELVSMMIARLTEDVNSDVRQAVMQSFYEELLAKQYLEEGGLDYARILLEKALSPERASEILGNMENSIQEAPFHFLQKAEAETLLTFIQDEHPQTIALILSHLEPNMSSEVLAGLTSKKQVEVIKRVAKMEQTSPETIKQVEDGLERRLSTLLNQEFQKTGGVDSVAEILNLIDRTTEKSILENLEEDDPDLVEQIRKLMFIFEDISLVNDKGIQALLKEVDNEELALALKTASEDLQNKIFNNMSERAAMMVKEEMEFMGPVRVADVEQSQQRIVDIVRRLEEAGEVIIQGRGGEDDVIV